MRRTNLVACASWLRPPSPWITLEIFEALGGSRTDLARHCGLIFVRAGPDHHGLAKSEALLEVG